MAANGVLSLQYPHAPSEENSVLKTPLAGVPFPPNKDTAFKDYGIEGLTKELFANTLMIWRSLEISHATDLKPYMEWSDEEFFKVGVAGRQLLLHLFQLVSHIYITVVSSNQYTDSIPVMKLLPAETTHSLVTLLDLSIFSMIKCFYLCLVSRTSVSCQWKLIMKWASLSSMTRMIQQSISRVFLHFHLQLHLVYQLQLRLRPEKKFLVLPMNGFSTARTIIFQLSSPILASAITRYVGFAQVLFFGWF